VNFPSWLSDQIREFGRQFKLDGLRLTDRGTAGVSFADGAELVFEYARERVAMTVTRPMPLAGAAAKATLAAAHPGARRQFRIRSGFFTDRARAFFVVRIPEREVTVEALSRAFNELWTASKAAERSAG